MTPISRFAARLRPTSVDEKHARRLLDASHLAAAEQARLLITMCWMVGSTLGEADVGYGFPEHAVRSGACCKDAVLNDTLRPHCTASAF